MTTVKYSPKWETKWKHFSRLKTPLGWLYWNADSPAPVFVPDPDHLWILEECSEELMNAV